MKNFCRKQQYFPFYQLYRNKSPASPLPLPYIKVIKILIHWQMQKRKQYNSFRHRKLIIFHINLNRIWNFRVIHHSLYIFSCIMVKESIYTHDQASIVHFICLFVCLFVSFASRYKFWFSKLAITYSKLAIETLEQDMRYAQSQK